MLALILTCVDSSRIEPMLGSIANQESDNYHLYIIGHHITEDELSKVIHLASTYLPADKFQVHSFHDSFHSPATSRNYGLSLLNTSQTPHVAFIDDDDTLYPNFVSSYIGEFAYGDTESEVSFKVEYNNPILNAYEQFTFHSTFYDSELARSIGFHHLPCEDSIFAHQYLAASNATPSYIGHCIYRHCETVGSRNTQFSKLVTRGVEVLNFSLCAESDPIYKDFLFNTYIRLALNLQNDENVELNASSSGGNFDPLVNLDRLINQLTEIKMKCSS